MEKIKGLHVENLKQEETDRGVEFNANLFMDGQAIGDIENRGDGGITMVHVKNDYQSDFKERVSQYYDEADVHDGEPLQKCYYHTNTKLMKGM
ncbi:hypothetical protein ACTWQB_16410 [Piscibacillus sp. B03]|uniref:hypothetical protein n=1 Tax=Piscibacillus sp. B03 TaxID=3457430 RepID=UPI003FCE53A4